MSNYMENKRRTLSVNDMLQMVMKTCSYIELKELQLLLTPYEYDLIIDGIKSNIERISRKNNSHLNQNEMEKLVETMKPNVFYIIRKTEGKDEYYFYDPSRVEGKMSKIPARLDKIDRKEVAKIIINIMKRQLSYDRLYGNEYYKNGEDLKKALIENIKRLEELVTERVSSISNLYSFLPENMRDDYVIGFHGFDPSNYCYEDSRGKVKIYDEKIKWVKESILERGLFFPKGKSLLSAIYTRKNELQMAINSEGYYSAGGIIVALPKVLKTKTGDSLFIGSPYEDKYSSNKHWNRDRISESTSLCELTLPEDGNLSPMFILGTYSKNNKDGSIDVSLNPKHIAYNGGTVPKEYFNKAKRRYFVSLFTNPKASDETSFQKDIRDGAITLDKKVSLGVYGKRAYDSSRQKHGTRIKSAFIELLRKLHILKDDKNDPDKIKRYRSR